jgi:putative transposase
VVAKAIRDLIHRMSRVNPTWGSPRIVGELRKLGIEVAKSTVEAYRIRSRQPPAPTWKAFLRNHGQDLVPLEFFAVPTVAHKVLFVLLILVHHRRQVVHVNLAEHSTAQWTAPQNSQATPAPSLRLTRIFIAPPAA